MENRHEPIIYAMTSGCTCRRWNGPSLRDGETQGAFTNRAKESHVAHVTETRMRQAELFPALTGLFASL